IPEPTTPKPLARKYWCPNRAPERCARGRRSVNAAECDLVQGAGESAPAEKLGDFGMLGEEVRERAGDFLEDLAVLLGGERRQDADVRDEELVVVAAARA